MAIIKYKVVKYFYQQVGRRWSSCFGQEAGNLRVGPDYFPLYQVENCGYLSNLDVGIIRCHSVIEKKALS